MKGRTLTLTFYLNPWVYAKFKPGDVGELTFLDCWRYRLGLTNDEGWWRGQCRFSRRAPEWGEFYEVDGDLRLERLPSDAWTVIGEPTGEEGHFLFYFKDETFECDAAGWNFKVCVASKEITDARTVSLRSGSSVVLIPPRPARKE